MYEKAYTNLREHLEILEKKGLLVRIAREIKSQRGAERMIPSRERVPSNARFTIDFLLVPRSESENYLVANSENRS